jgi:hypothetical protein
VSRALNDATTTGTPDAVVALRAKLKRLQEDPDRGADASGAPGSGESHLGDDMKRLKSDQRSILDTINSLGDKMWALAGRDGKKRIGGTGSSGGPKLKPADKLGGGAGTSKIDLNFDEDTEEDPEDLDGLTLEEFIGGTNFATVKIGKDFHIAFCRWAAIGCGNIGNAPGDARDRVIAAVPDDKFLRGTKNFLRYSAFIEEPPTMLSFVDWWKCMKDAKSIEKWRGVLVRSSGMPSSLAIQATSFEVLGPLMVTGAVKARVAPITGGEA